MKSKRIKIQDEELFYYESGSGPNLILIHGNMSSSVFFKNTISALDKYYHVYALDLRGFGNSTYNNRINKIKDFESDISDFILKLKLDDIFVLGWSLGGAITMEMLADEKISNRIKKVILLSSMGINGEEISNSFSLNNIGLDFLNLNYSLTKGLSFMNPFGNFIKAEDDIIRKTAIENIYKSFIYNIKMPNKTEYNRNIKAALKQKSSAEVGYAINEFNFTSNVKDVDMLIVHGRDDLVVPIDVAYENRDYFKNISQVIILEKCGHSPITDCFLKLNQIIKDFFR